jgi:Beta-lactamase enzyme family
VAALVVVGCLVVGMVIARAVSRDRHHLSTARSTSSVPVPSHSASSPLMSSALTSSALTTAPSSTGASSAAGAGTAQLKAQLAKTIAAYGGAGTVSVAAVNLSTGAAYQGGSTRRQWIGSAYKLLLAESLLLKEHGKLSDSEREDIALAIEHSDNPAGYRLYLDLGGQPGMMQQLRRLGVKNFNPGVYDPTLSTTSAADLVQVLRALVEPTPLSSASRNYLLGVLRRIERDQRWGVGAAATHGDFVNKNGWLSIDNTNPAGETDNGLWAVNSMGIVVVRGQKLLMAVMTQHNRAFADGVKRVETLAKLVARVVTA